MDLSIGALQQELAATIRANADALIKYDESTSKIRMRLGELDAERNRLQVSLEALHQARLQEMSAHAQKVESIEQQIVSREMADSTHTCH